MTRRNAPKMDLPTLFLDCLWLLAWAFPLGPFVGAFFFGGCACCTPPCDGCSGTIPTQLQVDLSDIGSGIDGTYVVSLSVSSSTCASSAAFSQFCLYDLVGIAACGGQTVCIAVIIGLVSGVWHVFVNVGCFAGGSYSDFAEFGNVLGGQPDCSTFSALNVASNGTNRGGCGTGCSGDPTRTCLLTAL